MRSPRFDIRATKLRAIFSPSNIEHIWKTKIRVSMRDQFANDGIEHFDFHTDSKLESKKLSKLILSGDYVPQKAQRILMEKSKGLCRQLVIPNVRDAIVLQCLSDALYGEIKGKAPTHNSFFEPRDHRFSQAPSEYGSFASWLNFQQALFNFSSTRKFIVVTDIANYYDSISYVHLRNSISSISGVEECIIDMLIYVLSDLLWQPDYTPRIEVGLPQINMDAPRLLAHCFLYELDAYLASDPKKDFVRFMDDIDIGVDSIVEAKKALRSVDLVLQTKQVRLNSGKTIILTQEEAGRHFRVVENMRLDKIKSYVEGRIKSGGSLNRPKRLIQLRISRGIRSGAFDAGNGEKILKRWIGLASLTGATISPKNLAHILRVRPGVRDNIYSLVRRRPLTPSVAEVLSRVARSGLLVDDVAMVEMANHLVETFVRSKNCDAHLQEIIASNDQDTYYGLYSKLWLQSKYGTTFDLLKSLKDSQNIWLPQDRLGRLVASFLPLFHNCGEEKSYLDLLQSSHNQGVREVYKFHLNLSRDATLFNNMFSALRVPNWTRGTGITHSKFLCLLSALRNPSAHASHKAKLKNNNLRAFDDAYYKSIAKRLGI